MANHSCANTDCTRSTSNPKYCSRKCAVTVNNQNQRRNTSASPRKCTWCGSLTPTLVIHYCNEQCRVAMEDKRIRDRDYRRIRKNSETDAKVYAIWSTGDVQGLVSREGFLTVAARRLLLRVRGAACEICDWSEVHPITGNVPVTVDHIDGDAANNLLENLRVLCPNCHSLTATYGSLNMRDSRVRNGMLPLNRKYARIGRVKNLDHVPER